MSPSVTVADALLAEQAEILEHIVRGAPLADVLARLCTMVEHHAGTPVRAAILLADPARTCLRVGAGPSLPAAYNAAVDGVPIDAELGTCARAAAIGEVVITADIANEHRWTALKHLPLAEGMVAAWSMPILSSANTVLGTFGTYFLERREPTAQEQRLVEVLSRTAALAIERERSDRVLRDSDRLHQFLSLLDNTTQSLSEPAEIMQTTARLLAEHLGVDRCAYAEIDDEHVFVITGDYTRGVHSIVGRWDVAAFGPACEAAMLAGEPFIVTDSEHDPRIGPGDLPAYRATDLRAVICVPLRKRGRFTAAMAVHQKHVRAWSAAEVELVTIVVQRCWEALERARITRDLRESEARSRFAARLSGVGFWYCDLPFDELRWDERCKAHFFLPPDARVTLETFYERIVPDDRELTRLAIDRSIGEHATYDIVYRTHDPASGAIKYIRALGGAAYDADGTPRRFDGVTVDVTAQKLGEQRLGRVAEAALRIHSARTLDAVLHAVTDEARSIIGSHQAVTSLTDGHDRTQTINTVSLSDKDAAYRSHDGPTTDVGIHMQVCKTNRPMRMTQAELEAHPAWRGSSGERDRQPPLRGWLAVPFVARDGSNLGLVQLSDKHCGEFTAEDEAVLVQLAQLAAVAIENARLYDQLREQDRRKDEFLATLAHELRNPLAPIRTGLEILQHPDSGPDRIARTSAMMERQLTHLVRMVDDLLDISRITLGKVTLKKERVDLRTVLESALETTRPLVEACGHTIAVELPAGRLQLEVDQTRLAQVFANLINNAAKYTPRGGRISIAAEIFEDDLCIRMTDTGVGIPAEMLPRVFDMFTQVGRSIERSQGGLGIGLTLVRRLVEMHGGSVHADSAGIGSGSTFTVRLPLAKATTTTVAPEEDRAPADRTALRVLVVDDNVDAADTLAALLELGGYDTRLAYSGDAALEVAAEFAPDVMFLDIGLPGLDGYEVARRLRANPSQPQPLLVALTGWGSEEDRREAHAAGFDRHLVKPIDTQNLRDVLASAAPSASPV